MSASISRAATWWSVILWSVSGGEYVPWFDNGNLFNKIALKYKRRSRKRGIKRVKKNIVPGIKQDQDPGWFRVIFSPDWMGSWAVFWWILGICTRTREQQQLKFSFLVQNKLTRCELPPQICRATLCVHHPCFCTIMCCIAKPCVACWVLGGLWHMPMVSSWWEWTAVSFIPLLSWQKSVLYCY